jgi:hypothetical protein
MTRWKASAIHLAISTSIAVIALTLMLLLWFAPPFFSAAGWRQVLLIMLVAILGPLITLIIFNTQKSRRALTFDLMVIGVLQFSALIFGASVMFHARPVFVVFIKDSFDMVVANQLSGEDISKAKDANYRTLPLTGPVYVYSELPGDIKERNEIVFAAFSGKDLPLFPRYYQPYAAHESEVGLAAKPIAELRKLNPNRIAEIDQAIKQGGWVESDIGFVPLRSKFEEMAVVVSKRDGRRLKVLPMAPW